MKLIIDIPEVDYECAKQRWMRGNDAHKIDYYVSKGIPLDDIKAEIEANKWTDRDIRFERNALASGLERAIEIIDSIGRPENEVANENNN